MGSVLFTDKFLEGPNIDVSELLKTWDIHGSGGLAAKIRSRLELATGADLRAGTLTPVSDLLAGQHLVRTGSGRYCPVCVKEDNAHGHLLWEVACVKACPIHGVLLQDSSICGAPRSEHLKVNARPRLSCVCSSCGSVGFCCVTEMPERASADEIWVATQVGRLLSCGKGMSAAWTSQHLRMGLHTLVEGWYSGSVVKASLAAGLSRASVSTWCAGVNKPSLAGLMQLCHHAQVDIVWLLGGRCEPAPTYDDTDKLIDWAEEDGDAERETALAAKQETELQESTPDASRKPIDLFGRSYVHRSCTIEDIKNALAAAVVESPPPNLTQLAARLGTSARFINEKWPDQARALVEASARYRIEQNQSRFDEATDVYESAARSLVELGQPVTPKYLQKVSGLVAFSQNLTRVRAMESVVQKFGTR
jgi:transcriptional regulator with XRE-family HTH domain